MPLFWFDDNTKPINEVEVDGQEMAGDEGAPPTDYTDTGSEDPQGTPPPEEAQPQDNQPPADGGDMGGAEEPPTDYTEEGGEGAPPPDDYGDGGGDSGSAPQQEEEEPVDELKAKEEELYGDLTDAQLDIKHKELKTRFLDMYDMTSEIVDRISDAIITEENVGVIEYISKNLNQLRQMISDYVASVYQTKSYTENSVNYNRFLAVLNGINKMLEQLNKKDE